MEVLCGERSPGEQGRVGGLISAFMEIGAPGPAAHRTYCSSAFFKQAERDGGFHTPGDRSVYLGLDDFQKCGTNDDLLAVVPGQQEEIPITFRCPGRFNDITAAEGTAAELKTEIPLVRPSLDKVLHTIVPVCRV